MGGCALCTMGDFEVGVMEVKARDERFKMQLAFPCLVHYATFAKQIFFSV